MRIELPFGRETLALEAPKAARVLLPPRAGLVPNPMSAVRSALRSPLAGPSLAELARPGQRVAIVISDITRPVPNATLLPPVLDELRQAGIDDEAIVIVNGTGLHRANTPAELDEMLGPELTRRYRIVQHDAFNDATLVEVGSSRGVPAALCRAYVEADLRIVTGFVEPHLFAGVSGGAKGVMPGVAGAAIVMSNHGAANLGHAQARWLRTDGNPVFEEMQAVVELCPPTFLLNVTLDARRRVTGVFAGEWRAAHAAAVAAARRQYSVPIERPYDVVVSTNMGHPTDLTFYQSVKGMSVAAEGVRDGGSVLLVAGCEEGLGGDEYARQLDEGDSPAALLEAICRRDRARHDQWQIQCQAMVQAKAAIYLHSRLSPDETRSAHVAYAADASETLRGLRVRAQAAGREGSVLVLPYGQLTVPVLKR